MAVHAYVLPQDAAKSKAVFPLWSFASTSVKSGRAKIAAHVVEVPCLAAKCKAVRPF